MIHDWLATQSDYLLFWQGIALAVLALACVRLAGRKSQPRLPWACLGLASLLSGIAVWLDMATLSMGDCPLFSYARVGVFVVSCVLLIEFGRRGLRKQDVRMPGPWLAVPLLVLAGLGVLAGPSGLRAASGYALALPGGLVSAWALWRSADKADAGMRTGLRCTAITLLVYVVAVGVLAPKAAFPPASWLHQDWFAASTGMPVFLLWAMGATVWMACTWLLAQSMPGTAGPEGIFGRWGLPMALAAMMALGWVSTEWRGRVADSEMRRGVLRQALGIAWTIPPDHVKALSFSPADKDRALFQRIEAHMRACGTYLGGVRGIYSMAQRNGAIVFGPENYRVDDPMASPPGTVFKEPSPQDRAAFSNGRPYVDGPVTDEYGTFVSGMAPVRDPHTGSVLMMVGIDILANTWMARIAAVRLWTILLTLGLGIALMAGMGIVQWRHGMAEGPQAWWVRYAEVVLAAVMGLVLAAALAKGVHDMEQRGIDRDFEQLADARAQSITEALRTAQNDLTSLARFIEEGGAATARKFAAYAGPLTRLLGVQAWQWVPIVPTNEAAQFVAAMRAQGLSNFCIRATQADTPVARPPPRAEHYPVAHMAPSDHQPSMLGLDMGNNPACLAAIAGAISQDMPVATAPFAIEEMAEQECGMQIFQLAHAEGGATPHGFASCVIRLDKVLEQVPGMGGAADPYASLALLDITGSGAPKLLAPYPGCRPAPGGADYPLLVAGRSWMLAVRPGAVFLAAHRNWQGVATFMAGILATLVVAAFVASLRMRQALLERLVLMRTNELNASEERFRDIAASMAECIWELDTRGRYTWCSHVEKTMLGYTPGELVGRSIYDLMEPAEAQRVRAVIHQFMTWKAPLIDLENWRIGKDGRRVCVSTSGVPVLDDHGDLMGYRGVDADITERKHAEAERMEMERRLFHAQKIESLGTLAGGFTHDFNNLLMTIGGNLDIAMFDLPADAPAHASVVKAVQACRNAADLTRDLQAYAGKGVFAPAPVSLATILRDNATLFRTIIAKAAVLQVDTAVSLPLVFADPGQIQQMLANLVTNASDSLGGMPGTIVLATDTIGCDAAHLQRSRLDEKPAPGTFVSVEVKDTGCGMDTQTQQRLFDPFFTTKARGRGLGMSTVLGIVRGHKGAIMVDSESGSGTRIKVLFPVTVHASGSPHA